MNDFFANSIEGVPPIASVLALKLTPLGSSGEAVSGVATGPSQGRTHESLAASMLVELAEWAAERFGLHPIAAANEPVARPDFWGQS
ncbi:MAG: hypothetical protein OXG57_02515 [Acidimicrobiaceae bacterium]|nr:hypothetical protein [Acidimicrobiaceae bacterium]